MPDDLNYLQQIARNIYREVGGTADYIPPSEEVLYLGYATLVLSKGVNTSNEDVHDMWSLWATVEELYGHTSLVPYHKLSPITQALDTPYRDAIRRVAYSRMFSRLTGKRHLSGETT